MKKSITIIRPGTDCHFTNGSGFARVLAATIKADGVSLYEVAWWHNGTRSTAWVEPHEITPHSTPGGMARIGFQS